VSWEWECIIPSHGNGDDLFGMGRNGNAAVPKIFRPIVSVHVSYFVAVFRLLLAYLFCWISILMDRVRLIMTASRYHNAIEVTFDAKMALSK